VDAYGRTTGEGRPDEGAPEAGLKRFELRTGRGHFDAEVAVQGAGRLTKSGDDVEPACAYFDLPPGQHHVKIRVKATHPDEGMVPRVMLAEYGGQTHDWYDSFQWKCGDPEACIKADLESFSQAYAARSRGIFDPCGSTRTGGFRWQVAHASDYRVEDVSLEFVLYVYKFPPRFPHGSGACKGLPGAPSE
jgi:hypothetical protein